MKLQERVYPNLFEEIGISKQEVQQRIESTFQTMFFDPEEKIYHEFGDDCGYMVDTGNNDARTEGMSYGMMMAVQMDRQDIFDRLWLFSKRYMQQSKGKYQGYFAWSVTLEGKKNAQNPAPDGEEYYALALFFASSRWGDKEAPFDYENQAKEILSHCIHQAEYVKDGHPMWNTSNYYIKFVVDRQITDPSYHLPHFYEIFAERANEEDRLFWKKAAAASREFINISCDKNTGMAPEYTRYDGSPVRLWHDGQFYSDAYRVALNIGLNAAWFGDCNELGIHVDHLQKYFSENTKLGEYKSYLIDGTALEVDALHPTAIIATLAAGSLAAKGEYRLQWVKDFWNTPLRTGDRRYYDNCLYFFSLLMLSGEYKIY